MPHVIVKLWSGVSELLAEREKVHGQATAAAIERVALTKTWVVYRAAAPTILQLFLICGDSRASPSEASPRRPSIGYARAGACTKRRGAETSGPRPPISSARRRASSWNFIIALASISWPRGRSISPIARWARAMRSRPAISTRRMIGLTDRADGRASFLRAPDTVAPPIALEPDNSPYRSPRCPGSRRASAGPLCPPRAPPPPAPWPSRETRP